MKISKVVKTLALVGVSGVGGAVIGFRGCLKLVNCGLIEKRPGPQDNWVDEVDEIAEIALVQESIKRVRNREAEGNS